MAGVATAEASYVAGYGGGHEGFFSGEELRLRAGGAYSPSSQAEDEPAPPILEAGGEQNSQKRKVGASSRVPTKTRATQIQESE